MIRRGKKIHAMGFVELVEHDELMAGIVFRVKDDTYNTFYKVYIQQYGDPKRMTLRCGCPYNLGDICKHEAAALFRLQDMADKNMLGGADMEYNQYHTVAKMKTIDLKTIRMLSSPAIYEEAEKLLRSVKANIISAKDEKVEAELIYNGYTYPLVIQKNDERNFDTSCTCSETAHPLCEHKTLLFLQLLNAYGPNYFDSIRNLDKEKNKLLQMYGYSLSDDLSGKFEFIYKEGKPYLKLLDPSIKKVTAPIAAKPAVQVASIPLDVQETIVEEQPRVRLGIVFNFNAKNYPGFKVQATQGEPDEEQKKFIGHVEALDLTKFVNTESYSEDDKQLFQQIRKMQEPEINKYLNRNSPFSGIWENIIHTEGEELTEDTQSLITEYMHPKLKRLFEEQAENPFVYILPHKAAFKTANLLESELSRDHISPFFKLASNGEQFEISCMVRINGQTIPLTKNECNSNLVFLYDDVLYLWQKTEDVMQVATFMREGNIKLNKSNWAEKMQQVILPLTREYHVEFDKSMVKEVKGVVPEVKLHLLEKGDYLVFQPIFTYQGYETKYTDKPTITIPGNDKILIIHRNQEEEESFIQKLENLHSMFVRQKESNNLVLKGVDVLRNNWFFLFVDAMKEMKVPVFGFEALRNFRFNTARPNTHIHVSSGLDWFDAKVEIEFGEQRVGIADIKKASQRDKVDRKSVV